MRLEIVEPGQPPKEVSLNAVLELGREAGDVRLTDPEVSRRHLRLEPAGPDRMSVTDLDSANGTYANEVRISGTVIVGPADTVRLGGTTLRMVAADVEPARGAVRGGDGRRTVDGLARYEAPAAVIRYRPGSAAERMVRSYANSVGRARRALAGLGSEAWGTQPEVCLVDPFRDPTDAARVQTDGSVVEAARGRIWVVATAESPPEPPGRALALFFGASLPAATEVEPLLEGFGLLADGAPDPDGVLRDQELPPLATATGELRALMACSFVRYLIERGGRQAFFKLISVGRPEGLNASAEELFGASIVALEEAWRIKLASHGRPVGFGAFLRRAAGYLRPHARREVETFAYMLLSLGFTLTFPFATRALFDDAIPQRDITAVAQLLAILGAAFALSLLAGLRRSYLTAYVSGSVVRRLRGEMFERLQGLSPGWFASRNQGDVLSRFFSDVAQVEAALSSVLREGLFQLLSLLVATIVLLSLNPLLGAVVLVGTPLVALTYRGMSRGGAQRSLEVQERQGALYTLATENYLAQPVVKALGLEDREVDRFERASERLFRSELRLQLFGGLFSLSVNLIVTALRLLIVGLGSWMILEGQLTVGGLVAFLGLMGEVIAPVASLTSLGQQMQEVSGSFARVDEILAETPDVSEPAGAQPLGPLTRDIRLAGVSFAYPAGPDTLHGVDCVIPAGSRVAFVGPSGSGKSSVLNLLIRFYDPTAGAVLFDDRDIRSVTLASVRDQIGIVLQDSFLFDTTIRENVRVGSPDATDSDVEAAVRAAELAEAVEALPGGLDARVGEGGARLSGGQRQRVAIARALVRNPRILLLDEATSALDARTERQIARTLDELRDGRTIISVTHRLAGITDFDHIFVLVDGRIVAQGTHGELIEESGTYADLWTEQTAGPSAARPSMDPLAALARVPLFADLTPADLQIVASKLRSVDLKRGISVRDQSGEILILARGLAHIRRPDAGGASVVVAEIGPGDAFGVAVALAGESDAMLEPLTDIDAFILDREAIVGIAESMPAVARALKGGSVGPSQVEGVQRLDRVTFGLRVPTGEWAASKGVEVPSADDIRRLTGTLPRVGP